MEVTKALSEYIVSLKFSDLPKDVVEGARLCFLDWLGVTLSGSKEPLTNILAAVAEEQGENFKPPSSAGGRRLPSCRPPLSTGGLLTPSILTTFI